MEKVKNIIQASIDVKQKVLEDDTLLHTTLAVVGVMVEALKKGKRIYFCGNGGSAADAQHLAAELSGRFYTDRNALPAEALHCNTSYLTAVANDYGFDMVYARFIDGIANKGDVLVGLSTSGNSANIVKAFESAKAKGLITVGFTGITGGIMKTTSDYLLNIPSADTPRIQESHILLGHIICQLVEEKMFAPGAPLTPSTGEDTLPHNTQLTQAVSQNKEAPTGGSLQPGRSFSHSKRDKEAAIILAGGLGTRLRSVVEDVPKCMAPVAGRPFISHIIDYLRMQGIEEFVFSLGFKAETIVAYLEKSYPTLSYTTVIENEPLGTGGAIRLACQQAKTENVLVVNGDTLFKVSAAELTDFHQQHKAECTIALKHMNNFDRYGVVEVKDSGQVLSFKEKQFYEEGWINGGVYLLNRSTFLQHSFPEKFSFEKDYLEKHVAAGTIYGCVQKGYFIDIGIPEDYRQVQTDLAPIPLDLKKIDKSWTLFLDRDGVVNEERVGEYILNWEQFIFSPGALNAFKVFAQKFGKIIIISNQRGVGKKLMSEDELLHIHNEMQKEVTEAGSKIDKIYYCTDKDEKCFNRKPNPGMALQAVNDFPDIDLSKTIMVGNKPSDMRFGRSAGTYTVFLATTNPDQPYPHADIDLRFDTLQQLAEALTLG